MGFIGLFAAGCALTGRLSKHAIYILDVAKSFEYRLFLNKFILLDETTYPLPGCSKQRIFPAAHHNRGFAAYVTAGFISGRR
jgi:hypothetical protein